MVNAQTWKIKLTSFGKQNIQEILLHVKYKSMYMVARMFIVLIC